MYRRIGAAGGTTAGVVVVFPSQQAADASRTDGQHVPQVPARNGLQRRSGTSGRQPSIAGRAAPPTKR